MSKWHRRYQRVVRKVAHIVKERDNWRCRYCKSKKDLEVHHIIPLSKGGSLKPFNCLTVCKDCHIKLHASPLSAARAQWRAFSDGL